MERSFNLGTLLKNREKKHKIKPAQFVSIAGGIQKRLETNLKNRRSSRLTIFDKIRNLPSCESPLPLSAAQSKVERRRQQLEKWKEEKEKRKKEQAAQKKKPFVAGVPHVSLKFVLPPPVVPSTSGRVTRSQSAKNNVTKKIEQKAVKPPQSFAPKNASFRPPQIKNLAKVPILAPVTKQKETKSFVFNFSTAPTLPKQNDYNTKQTRTRANKVGTESRVTIQRNAKELKEDKIAKGRVANKQSKKNIKVVKDVVSGSSSSETEPLAVEFESKVVLRMNTPKRTQRKAKNATPKSESSSEERLRSPKSPAHDSSSSEAASTPVVAAEESKRISPCVTLSRGKDNARREMKKKLEEGLLDEDTRDRECVEDFRRQLNLEIIRLTEMCDSWEKIREQTPLAEIVQDEVLGAVGQARLLMSSKLQQFSSLVERCARPPPGAPLVTPTDLQGFWDMVFMQIVNIDMRFKRLEQRRENNWIDEQTSQPVKKTQVRNNVKKATKPAAGPSRLREMIAAARKAKKQQEDQNTAQAPVGLEAPSEDNKTFEAGFFCVRSPVRSPAPGTPNNKTSLLKAVLSSEAKKASTSKKPFAMLRASIMSKSLESEGIAPLPQTPLAPININATPGRSILKSTNVSKSGKKSIKVVLFDESDTELQDKHLNEIPKDKAESEHNTDSGMSSMDIEKDVENKENSRRKSKIVRQDAVEEERSPVMTRNRRKSAQNTPQEVKTRSRRTLQAAAENIEVIPTPKRSSRRRKSATLQSVKA